MKNFTLLFVFIFVNSFGQNIPELTTKEKNVVLKKLNIEVEIINNIAVTTYDMQFYNPNNRILEGELAFPLQQNQLVTRFALDINGLLREAVVVEKEKARVAFESTVRQRIDPALLEKTKGNNYKTRVYPIPAKGYKRVVLAYQEELAIQTNNYGYRLPLHFKKKLDDFSLSIKVLNIKNEPIVKSEFIKGFTFDKKTKIYSLKFSKKKFKSANEIFVKIPVQKKGNNLALSNNYFYYNTPLHIVPRKKDKVNKVTIFWDNSLSQKNKRLISDVNLLDAYFKTLQNVKVQLITFNASASKPTNFQVNNGNWNSLKTTLENQIYDGGSSFDFLQNYKDDSDEYLLFTDGLNTFSDLNFNTKNKRVYTINSSVSANHLTLKNLANSTGGSYINLQKSNTKKGLEKLMRINLQFLGTSLNDKTEIYPQKGEVVFENFALVGKNRPTKNFKIYFGYGKTIIKKIEVNVTQPSYENNVIKKMWATKKINFLSKNKEDNETEIVNISKEYQVISPFTSMLILDRIEDYVTHNIEPPKELRSEFKRLISLKKDNKDQRLKRLQESLFNEYQDFLTWYDKKYEVKKEPVIKTPIIDSSSTSVPRDTVVENSNSRNTNNTIREGTTTKTGIVSDESGPLPGVSVLVKGSTISTETDFDGKYSINVKTGDILVFSFVGMENVEKTVDTSNTIDVKLEGANVLDEVVVVGYETTRQRRNLSYSVSEVSAEEVSNSLMGKVSGVNVNSPSGVVIRGANSISQSNNPLYVVDGKIVKNIRNLKPDTIKSLYVLKHEQSKKIYGNKAKNGMIVIITKKGLEKHSDAIEDFEDMVKEKIELKGWIANTPYLKELKLIKDNYLAYKKYLELRSKYETSISYFIDVADMFFERNQPKIATKILSNVAEVDLNNYELLRSLAYKLEEYKRYNKAVYIYKEILKLRPEDIQSYRDLALAYEMNNEYQKSLDLLNQVVNGELLLKDEDRRYKGIESISFLELNRLLNLKNNKVDTTKINVKKAYTPLDLRVVIDWNHNDTDIDLWVIDPNKEKCYYKHTKTKIGGVISDDMTEGFGPEQFTLKDAIKGKYEIKAKYYSNSQQKISGPTFLKITVFKNYGKENEEKTVQLVRLTKQDEIIDLGTIQM